MSKDILSVHLDILREEISIEETKNTVLPIYSLQFLKSNNRIPEEAMISTVMKNEDQLFENLKEAFYIVEKEVPQLKGIYKIFPDGKLSQKVLFNFLLQVNNLTLSNKEWTDLIEEFFNLIYENEGRKGGNTYSPQSVNKLGIELIKPISGSFYDGVIGIGGTAVESHRYAKNAGGEIKIFGQELDFNNWALAKFNLLFHGIEDANIQLGDTLFNPAFGEDDVIAKFDRIMMDFPFSMQVKDYETLVNDQYNRFIYGNPPRRSADMAFIMHGLSSLNQYGKAAFVVTNGTLFRQGVEETIRQNMIDVDVIEAVIALPENIYAETSIQTNLLILNKNKPTERQGKILLINAEEEYQQLNKRRKYLDFDSINKIVDIYENGIEIKSFSKFIESTKIKDADLLVKRYLKDREIVVETFGKVQVLEDKINDKENNIPLLKYTKSIYRGLNVSTKSVEEGHGDYKIIKLSDVQDGEINVEKLTPVTLKRKSRVDNYLVQVGDVIISNRGSNIKIAVVPHIDEKIILSHNFLGIRLQKDKLDPWFLKEYLESPVGQYMISSKQIGTNILTINPKDLEDILVPVLDINDQLEIVEGFYGLKISIQEQLQQLEKEKMKVQLKLYENMGIRDYFKIIE